VKGKKARKSGENSFTQRLETRLRIITNRSQVESILKPVTEGWWLTLNAGTATKIRWRDPSFSLLVESSCKLAHKRTRGMGIRRVRAELRHGGGNAKNRVGRRERVAWRG